MLHDITNILCIVTKTRLSTNVQHKKL